MTGVAVVEGGGRVVHHTSNPKMSIGLRVVSLQVMPGIARRWCCRLPAPFPLQPPLPASRFQERLRHWKLSTAGTGGGRKAACGAST